MITQNVQPTGEFARSNKSFARRIGKALGVAKKQILRDSLPNKITTAEKLPRQDKLILEIGFGMGEHFLELIKNNQDAHVIGAEVYLNGVASLLLTANNEFENFSIWPDDIDLLIGDLPDNSIDAIYILFPDPWPKLRQQKRRLFNQHRLEIFACKLKNKGNLYFASDIDSYFDEAYSLLQLFNNGAKFEIESNTSEAHQGYVPTKYHKKAVEQGAKARFIKSKIIKNIL